jgi:ABC-type molybdate transport system ATPase subunit
VAERLELDAELERGGRALRLRLSTSAGIALVRGPSGAGKTTLLRVLAGLEPSARGRAVFSGAIWQDGGIFVPAWRRGAAWVPQESLLFPHLSAGENLAFARPAREELEAVARGLEVGGLLERAPALLSGGERQRVALGRALLAGPRLLLLDEPFAALDDALRVRVRTFVRRWVDARGVAAVLVSHDAEDGAIADERWVIADGALSRA